MAIASIGYDTTTEKRVTEIDWAKALPRIGGSFYGVDGANDWKVSAVAGQDRTVSINVGSGWGHGVHDTLPAADGNFTLQLDSILSGSRWDLVACRRAWQATGGGPTAFVKVGGSSTKEIPAGRINNPGVQDDQPLALVQVTAGSSQPTGLIDLRCWASNGGLLVADKLALDYLAFPGARAMLGEIEYRYLPDVLGDYEWRARYPSQGGPVVVPISNGADLGSAQVTFPIPFSTPPSVTLTKAMTSGPLSSLRRLQPVAKGVTATGFTAYIETNDGQGVGANFNVDCFYNAVPIN